jgi:hypothetical protein
MSVESCQISEAPKRPEWARLIRTLVVRIGLLMTLRTTNSVC